MNLLRELQSYASTIKVQVYDEDSLGICQRAIEINTTKVLSTDAGVVEDMELTFVLFFMYLQGYEYGYTLGSSYMMNYIDDELTLAYRMVCSAVHGIVVGCVHDSNQYKVPEYVLNTTRSSEVVVSRDRRLKKDSEPYVLSKEDKECCGAYIMNYTSRMDGREIVRILYLLHKMFRDSFTESDLLEIIYLLNKNPGKSYSKEGYDQSLSIHSTPIVYKNIEFPTLPYSIKKICEDVLTIQEVVFERKNPSFSCVRNMLAPMKAVLFHRTHRWMYCDFSLFQNICTTDTLTISFILNSLIYHKISTPEDELGLRWVLLKLGNNDHDPKDSSFATSVSSSRYLPSGMKDGYERIEPYYKLLGYSHGEFAEDLGRRL